MGTLRLLRQYRGHRHWDLLWSSQALPHYLRLVLEEQVGRVTFRQIVLVSLGQAMLLPIMSLSGDY